MVVFFRDTGHLVFLFQVDRKQLVGFAQGVAGGEQLLFVQHGHGSIVIHAVGELFHFPFQVGAVNHAGGMPHACEVEGLVVGCPAVTVHARLEGFGHVGFLSAVQVHHAETVAVAFVSVAFHALPGDVLSIGRELRVSVVTHVLVGGIFLAEVAGLLGFHIV